MLKTISNRSGLKLKEVFDEIIKRSGNGSIWKETKGELSDCYKQYLILDNSDRVTFEITEKAEKILLKICNDHTDLTKDQILNIAINIFDFAFKFPLKKDRAKLAKYKQTVRKIKQEANRMEKELKDYFGDNDLPLFCINWNEFSKELTSMESALNHWSQINISRETHGEIPKGRNL